MATKRGRSCCRPHGNRRHHSWQPSAPCSQLLRWSRRDTRRIPLAPCCTRVRRNFRVLRRNGAKSSESALGTTSCALSTRRWHRIPRATGWWLHSPAGSGCSTSLSWPHATSCCRPRSRTSHSHALPGCSTTSSWTRTSPAASWRSPHGSHRCGRWHGPHPPRARGYEGEGCRARCEGSPSAPSCSRSASSQRTSQRTSSQSLHRSHRNPSQQAP
mmetsp:Transcript_33395/g.71955  ORF Transcript_33395/g.71955 Transcript_33395/m.71955 type:complete len:215 (-) Transcript_33395:980-1624(-)